MFNVCQTETQKHAACVLWLMFFALLLDHQRFSLPPSSLCAISLCNSTSLFGTKPGNVTISEILTRLKASASCLNEHSGVTFSKSHCNSILSNFQEKSEPHVQVTPSTPPREGHQILIDRIRTEQTDQTTRASPTKDQV